MLLHGRLVHLVEHPQTPASHARPPGGEPPATRSIHPPEIIDNQAGGVEFKVADNVVVSKGPKHVIRALGSPLCFAGSPGVLIAEMQARGRRAFSKHHGTLMANAPLKGRLQLHTTLVRQSALWACQTWPCIACILKAANTLQLLHARTLLKHPRQHGEPWAQWHIRSMRKARVMLFRYHIAAFYDKSGAFLDTLPGG